MNLGILGGGQLARMLALAAYPLGIRTICIDPNPQACAQEVTRVVTADFTDQVALQNFINSVDVVTYETENIPLACANEVAQYRPLYPSADILNIAQDRLHEKIFFNSLQIPTPAFAEINSEKELENAVSSIGFPCVLKTRRLGYDGKGQMILKKTADITPAWQSLQNSPLILESFVPFEYEVSLIAVRNQEGEIRFYPLVLNHHTQGILRYSEAPLNASLLQEKAENYLRLILEKLNYIGVLAVEFFYDGQQLLANEMAPRVHNSGHWTIEGAQTSQFENHLRAIFNLPLGGVQPIGQSFMLNCIGEMPPLASINLPGTHYHIYGKKPQPERKLGHITLVDLNSKDFNEKKTALLKHLS